MELDSRAAWDKTEKIDSLQDVNGRMSLQLEVPSDHRPEYNEENVKAPECLYHRSESGKEFITVQTTVPSNIDQMRWSARLVHADLEIWLQNLGSLMLIDDGFIAKVAPINVNELEQGLSFAEAKSILLRQLRIVRIALDDATTERDSQRSALLNLFDQIRSRIATCRACLDDAARILRIAESSNSFDYCKLCKQLRDNPDVSGELEEQAVRLLQIERAIQRRNGVLESFGAMFPDDMQELNNALLQVNEAVVSNKVDALLKAAPQFLRDQLKNVSLRIIYRVNENDVKAFSDIESALNVDIFCKPLAELAKRWIDCVKSSEFGVPLVTPIFISLCRSLAEVIGLISHCSEHEPEELLRSNQRGWHRLETEIEWRSGAGLAGCLEREYNFLFRLLNHFDPAAGTVGPFEYQAEQPFEGTIADELLVWFYLLDDVLRDLDLGPFQQIVTSFVQLLHKSDDDQAEKIRIFAHSIGRFIVQTCPLANSTDSNEDKQILHSQLDVMNRAMFGCDLMFRDLLDAITCYWKYRCEIVDNFPWKHSMLTIVTLALRSNEVSDVITLLRAVNDQTDQTHRVIELHKDQHQESHAVESWTFTPVLPLGLPETLALDVSEHADEETKNLSGQLVTPKSSASSPAVNAALPPVARIRPPKITTVKSNSFKISSHECSWCNKSFRWLNHLNRHKRVHTKELPFRCAFCDKRFAEKGNLRHHMCKHTGEKRFICGQAFKQHESLKRCEKEHAEQ